MVGTPLSACWTRSRDRLFETGSNRELRPEPPFQRLHFRTQGKAIESRKLPLEASEHSHDKGRYNFARKRHKHPVLIPLSRFRTRTRTDSPQKHIRISLYYLSSISLRFRRDSVLLTRNSRLHSQVILFMIELKVLFRVSRRKEFDSFISMIMSSLTLYRCIRICLALRFLRSLKLITLMCSHIRALNNENSRLSLLSTRSPKYTRLCDLPPERLIALSNRHPQLPINSKTDL